ncbi:hypothetical protein AVEN_158028-1 [Araneus ventricosus]|uniref:Uncharacterized protein n=1 Tax=Araneus ventricosus TaxID=182803 RepID=A0A4Y2TND6_ARAVE|nr:hypothetical protein AVEN_5899-1 [Araneus ventricosus]GBO01571.1 hypothetical protein AVEN_158028-1 [Araneus ventricosus]
MCHRADFDVLRQIGSEPVQQIYQTHQTMVEEISNYSGLDYSIGVNSFNLFDTLDIERMHNLTVPEWAIYYWDEMRFLAYGVIFPTFYSSPIQLRLRTGPFLEIVTANLKNKINGNTPDLKVVMNSDVSANDEIKCYSIYAANCIPRFRFYLVRPERERGTSSLGKCCRPGTFSCAVTDGSRSEQDKDYKGEAKTPLGELLQQLLCALHRMMVSVAVKQRIASTKPSQAL